MGKSLAEYADDLFGQDRRWPEVPPPQPIPAKPATRVLPDIRAVSWSLYGTLLRISDGTIRYDVKPALRTQIALEKTLEEFGFWGSMLRKPGHPWEHLQVMFRREHERRSLVTNLPKGNVVEVDIAAVWEAIITDLQKKDYSWDEQVYGDRRAYAEKIALFFQSCLQGIAANDGLAETLSRITDSHFMGLTGTAQCFSLVQLRRAARSQQPDAEALGWFEPNLITLSYDEGMRPPSRALYETAAKRFRARGIAPEQVLHVGSRIRADLLPARQAGFKTALYAGDLLSLQVTPAELKDDATKPDRLITHLSQVASILGLDD